MKKIAKTLCTKICLSAAVVFSIGSSVQAASNYEGGTLFNGHTYKAFLGGVDWTTAESLCEQIGGHLVKITNSDTQVFVEKLIQDTNVDHFWIGLSDQDEEGDFIWADGEGLSYANWGESQPDNYNDSEDHVVINSQWIDYGGWSLEKGVWNDINESGDVDHPLDTIGIICEWDTDLITQPAEMAADIERYSDQFGMAEVITFNGHYYAAIDDALSWDEAKIACESRGGYLATINSQREQQFLQTAVIKGNKPYYWIGLTDAQQEGNFVWISGEPLTYTNWGENQPDNWNDSEDSVMFPNRDRTYEEWSNSFGTWNDMNSLGDRDHDLNEMGYICEWDFLDSGKQELFNDMFDELEQNLADKQISVLIDKANGTITMNNAILFDFNSFEITSQGRETLHHIMDAFYEIMTQEKYRTLISTIMIQGHTDSSGSYEYNLDLSEKRAKTVYDYCMSTVSEDAQKTAMFSQLFATSGCSYDFPVLDAAGNEDMDASRRVNFVFYVGR